MTWYYDQWITTHGLLLKNICTVPPWSGLWNKKGRALIRQKIFCHKCLFHSFHNLTKGPFNNCVDKMRGGGGQKISVFDQA